MKFTHIKLTNFGMHKDFETDLYDRTSISGCNAIGKSTIKRAIFWVLNLKNENGKEITGIRPHDSEGKDIDDVVTEVELTIDNGVTLKKSYYKKRNKKGEVTGNQTDYSVMGIPKSTTEYSKYVSSLIPSELCVNAQSFLRMYTDKRRDLLEKTFGLRSTDEIIEKYPEFESLKAMLSIGTVEEVKSHCRRDEKSIAKQLDEIKPRIDELESQKVDIDVAELELLRNSINDSLCENHAKQKDLAKRFEEFDKASDGIMELRFKLNDIIRQENEENYKARKEIENKIDEKDFLVTTTSRTYDVMNMDIKNTKLKIDNYQKEIEKLREEYKETQDLEFDENSLICQHCGQEYPSEKKDELRAEFERHKEEELKTIEEYGKRMKSKIETEQETIRTLELELSDYKKSLETLNEDIADLEKQLAELPQSIDISDRADVVELQNQIAEKEKALKESNSFSEVRQQLIDEESELQSQLLDVERQIARSENNVDIDERILELQKMRKVLAQKEADQQRILDLLKQFDRRKQELLTADVNKYFNYAEIVMFTPQLNGEMKDVCQLSVKGESYDRNLNVGAKMLTEIDICRAFQSKLGVELPIIVDEASSLDAWRVPTMENQIITIRRDDNKKLTVSET